MKHRAIAADHHRKIHLARKCAGRDAIGARSGGECAIAAIVPVSDPKPTSARKTRRRR